MKNPSKVVFLESQRGTESLFTRGLRSGAQVAGWKTELVFVADSNGRPRPVKEVRDDLVQARPDTICFLMDAPLDLKDLWDTPSLAETDKISLWFDDYYRSPRTLAHPEIWADWQCRHGVRVGIWDGYWRQQWKAFTGFEAFPVHLAADSRAFSPRARPWNPAWSDRAIFIGTIPSQRSLDEALGAFPAPLARLADDVYAAMWNAPWPLRPYHMSQTCQSYLGHKYRLVIEALLRDCSVRALWNYWLWRMGKRIARLRGLAAVIKTGPVAILSGHGTEDYAGEEELRTYLPLGTNWVFADTRTVPSNIWSSLFRTGKWQMQITDPQSIEGGLPFRVFECGACAVPLLSDSRPELKSLFPGASGLTLADNETAVQENASRMFETSPGELAAQGRDLYQHFIKKHTWEIRWRQLARRPVYQSVEDTFSVPAAFFA